MKRKIYLASSWRNKMQPLALSMLRGHGHDVYDFRNPAPGNSGFAWSDIDKEWLTWSPETFAVALTHSTAEEGYGLDKAALDWSDTGILLLPCGKSAHLEAGYLIGQKKPVLIVLNPERFEPELMYKLAGVDGIVAGLHEMIRGLNRLPVYVGTE